MLIVFSMMAQLTKPEAFGVKEQMNKSEDVLFQLLDKECNRQKQGINLIASENYASEDVLSMLGSCLMNKYVEGNVGARYYSGFEFVDPIEQEVIDRFKELFGAEHANVEPHAGTQANLAVYLAALKPGDTILSMSLPHGGHLSHGHPVTLVGSVYNIVSYGVDKESELIDYDEVERLALEHKPKMIVAGASAYSRQIDFERFSQIAKKVDALLLADIAHIAGLVAAGVHPSPVPCADFVTFTTHKTFRGPRGAVILCKKEWAKKVDKAVMPGSQGGAFMHVIAAKGIACAQAMKPSFVEYQNQVIQNAQAMVQEFEKLGYRIVSGGTDNHMFLIDLSHLGITGKKAEKALESVGIFVNRNTIPFDTKPPMQGSGIRIGTAAVTTRGAQVSDAIEIVHLVHTVLESCSKEEKFEEIALQVGKVADKLA